MAQTPVSEPDIQRILSTIKQVESGGNYGIKAQGSSASGAYQFIDKTWQDSTKKYGIGTEYKSAKDAPPEIQDAVAQRAVRDILGQVGGDVSKVPLVWYTGNPQGRMTEEQIKANQGQTADQYQKKWLATFGRGATTKVATAPAAQPSTATRGPRTTAQVGGGMTLASLPENYRIALATSYLGETEDPEEAVAEKALRLVEESQQGGGAAKTQKLLAQAVPDETVNPFKFLEREPEPQRRRPVPRIPRMMAAGGPVGEMAGTQAMEVDGFSNGGMAELTDEEKQKAFEEHQARTMAQARYFMGPMVASAVKKPGGYEARIAAPIRGVEPYVDVNPMSGRIQPTEYGVQYGQMGPQGGYQLRYAQPIAPSGMKVPPQITGQYRRQLDRDSEIQASGFYAPIPNMRDAYGANVRYVRRFEKGGEVEQNPADIAEQMTVGTRPSPPKYPPTMLSREEGIRMIRSRTPGLFGPLGPLVGNYIVKKGYLPPTIQEFLGYPPPADVWDPEELKKTYGEKEVVRRQAGSPEEGEMAAQQMTVGTLPEDQKPAGQVFRGIGRDIVRGAQYLPYDLLGAPVDIATMAMRPFGYNVEKPVGGSEYLIEKARQAGIAQAPTGSAAETATRIGMGFVNPAAVARQIPKGIAALERGAETLGTGAVRAITGKPDITPEQIYQAMGDTKGILQLGAPAAVKPGGGVVNADEMIDSLTNVLKFDVKAEGQKFDDIFKWIDTKARSYYEKQFGSPSDPLFRAFMSGDFDPQFNHINNTVRETYEDTIKHGRDLMSSTSTADQRVGRAMLSNIYDAVTPIVAQYGPQTIRNRLLNPKFREEIQRYIMEERNLGPAKLTPKARLNYEKEIDSYLDEFAKTGNLSTKAPFDVVDINKAASQNIVDDVGNKIETQTRKTFNLSDESYGFLGQWPGYGTALEKTHALPSAYSKNYPDYLATTAERQAVKFGEPTYFISKQPEEVHADLRNLIGYLNRTPADEWKNTSFPDLVVKAQKDYSNITDPQEIYKRLNNYQKVTPKQRLIGTQEFMPVESKQLGEGATWRELDENGILIEGRLLRHCLSEDEKYRNFYKNGMSRFFALRDKEGKSYATIQIDRLGMDGPFANVHQIKGWKNDSVGKKYDKEIMDFLNRYQANQINVPLRYTEESSFLPVSLAGGERVRVVEGDAPFVRQYVEFFRTLDRNLIDRGMATPEDLGDFNYVLDRIRDLPTEAQQKEFADTFLKAFAEGYNKPLKFIYHLGGWRTGQLGEPQPVWQNPPVNRAKGGMVDKPLYDRAA